MYESIKVIYIIYIEIAFIRSSTRVYLGYRGKNYQLIVQTFRIIAVKNSLSPSSRNKLAPRHAFYYNLFSCENINVQPMNDTLAFIILSRDKDTASTNESYET